MYIYISDNLFKYNNNCLIYLSEQDLLSVSTVTYSYHCQAFEKGSGLTAVTAVDEHRPLDGD